MPFLFLLVLLACQPQPSRRWGSHAQLGMLLLFTRTQRGVITYRPFIWGFLFAIITVDECCWVAFRLRPCARTLAVVHYLCNLHDRTRVRAADVCVGMRGCCP